jgi:hypothetical protein
MMVVQVTKPQFQCKINIYSAEHGLTEDLHILQSAVMRAICTHAKGQTYSWVKPISLSEIVHKDYERKGLFKKTQVVVLNGLGAKTNWLLINRQS